MNVDNVKLEKNEVLKRVHYVIFETKSMYFFYMLLHNNNNNIRKRTGILRIVRRYGR